MSTTEAMSHPLVREVVGNGWLRALEMVEICGEEAEHVSPELWTLLAPSDVFERTPFEMYRAHVRELVARAQTKQPLSEATKPEVLMGLVEASRVAPLTQRGQILYHALFIGIFGQEAYHDLLGAEMRPPKEQWLGQIDEMLYESCRKVRTGRPKKLKGPVFKLRQKKPRPLVR